MCLKISVKLILCQEEELPRLTKRTSRLNKATGIEAKVTEIWHNDSVAVWY